MSGQAGTDDNIISSVVLRPRCLAGVVLEALVLLLMVTVAAHAGPRVIVELEQNNPGESTSATTFGGQAIVGTGSAPHQPYKFQRQRTGRHFTYAIANLDPSAEYSLELSFVEHEKTSAGSRVFNVRVNGVLKIFRLDIFVLAGANNALQQNLDANTDGSGLLKLEFSSDAQGCAGQATISTIRVYRGAADAVDVDASASRNRLAPEPVRHYNTSSQDTYEAILGRLGSRASLDLMPQRLASRFSTLGTWTADESELVVALKQGAQVRALPFTDRFPLWENIDQSESMTSVSMACSSPSMPLEVSAVFRAPFYPRDEKVSGAPFFYVDVTVTNSGRSRAAGSMLLAMPHKEQFAGAGVAGFSDGTATGLTSTTSYSYQDETLNGRAAKAAAEALVLPSSESGGVTFLGARAGEFSNFNSGHCSHLDRGAAQPLHHPGASTAAGTGGKHQGGSERPGYRGGGDVLGAKVRRERLSSDPRSVMLVTHRVMEERI